MSQLAYILTFIVSETIIRRCGSIL